MTESTMQQAGRWGPGPHRPLAVLACEQGFGRWWHPAGRSHTHRLNYVKATQESNESSYSGAWSRTQAWKS